MKPRFGRIEEVNKELWLLLSLFGICLLLNLAVDGQRMLLSFYTLPTLGSAYLYGRRHATLTALGGLAALRPRIGLGPLVAALYFLITLAPAAGFIDAVGYVGASLAAFVLGSVSKRAGWTAAFDVVSVITGIALLLAWAWNADRRGA